MPGWGSSIARSTNCCHCSRRAPRPTSTTSDSASAVAGARTCGPIQALPRWAPTPAEACGITRPSSRSPCSKDALVDLTNRGDIVLDPFLGSGSTLMAAEKTGRVCRGLELDPLYVDVVIRRFEIGYPAPLLFYPKPGSRLKRSPRGGPGKLRSISK